eukprot:s172_g16.t1
MGQCPWEHPKGHPNPPPGILVGARTPDRPDPYPYVRRSKLNSCGEDFKPRRLQQLSVYVDARKLAPRPLSPGCRGPICANLSGRPQGKNDEKTNAADSESSLNQSVAREVIATDGKAV